MMEETGMKLEKEKKNVLKSSWVTYGMVILVYVLVEIALKTVKRIGAIPMPPPMPTI